MASLLDLPWDVRRVILRRVIRPPKPRREPVFDKKFMKGRIRLRNCFDETRPEATNIYVEKPQCLYPTIKALLETCRQLREETTLLINKYFKTGKVEAPFVLDIMYVKDVGVFPTWISFPYKTKRILRLAINVRIIRPDPRTVPAEWISAARFPMVLDKYGVYRRPSPEPFWNFYAVVALYSLNRLSIKATANETHKTNPKKSSSSSSSSFNHTTAVMDAHLIPMEATPYVVDRLSVHIKKHEYKANGTAITTAVEDNSRLSPFYKEGYIQFGREVFEDYDDYSDSWQDYEMQQAERAAGLLAGGQLAGFFWDAVHDHVDIPHHGHFIYQSVLANSVGEITVPASDGSDLCRKSMHTASWVSTLESGGIEWETMNISKAIAEEEALDDPAQSYIDMLKIAKRRRALGWQAQSLQA